MANKNDAGIPMGLNWSESTGRNEISQYSCNSIISIAGMLALKKAGPSGCVLRSSPSQSTTRPTDTERRAEGLKAGDAHNRRAAGTENDRSLVCSSGILTGVSDSPSWRACLTGGSSREVFSDSGGCVRFCPTNISLFVLS